MLVTAFLLTSDDNADARRVIIEFAGCPAVIKRRTRAWAIHVDLYDEIIHQAHISFDGEVILQAFH